MKLKRFVLAAALAVGVLAGQAAMATGPDATGPAKYGLCMAYFSGAGGEHGAKNDAPLLQNLADAAEDNNQSIEEFCEDARPGNGSGGSGDSQKHLLQAINST